jgi:hypothetical protein
LLEKSAVIDFLIDNYPKLLLKKIENIEQQNCLILSAEMNTEKLIEVLEMLGTWYIFEGDDDARKHGFTFRILAMSLRYPESGISFPKIILPHSRLRQLVLNMQTEINNIEDLNELSLKDEPIMWKRQGFLITKRFSKSYDRFPNVFIVFN